MNKNAKEIASKIGQGDRLSLAKAITLIESRNKEKFQLGLEVLQNLPSSGPLTKRIGITGVPGAGKSTFIETMGLVAIEKGYRVAVLAIDPSSSASHGSILGDKTRMMELSSHPKAFVRPSPTGKILGGAGPSTPETILLCEAAGFDFIIVETVGVGQSETDVAQITDMTLLLALPNLGDELQGIKRGIMEIADLILVNKSEGERKVAANQAKRQLENALHLMVPKPHAMPVEVLLISALEKMGIQEALGKIEEFYVNSPTGFLEHQREINRKNRFMELSKSYVLQRLMEKQEVKHAMQEALARLSTSNSSPALAAFQWAEKFDF